MEPEYDLDAAYELYLERFTKRFGEKPLGAFVKVDRHMVTKLARGEFAERLSEYLRMHEACRQMLTSGATINDAIMLDFAEVAAWVCVQPPDMLAMFRGELGDPDATAPMTRTTRPAGPNTR
jgi:hypothetical protein